MEESYKRRRVHLLGHLCAQGSMEAWRALSLQRGFTKMCTQEWSRNRVFWLKYGGLTFILGWSLHVLQSLPHIAIYPRDPILGLSGHKWSREMPQNYTKRQHMVKHHKNLKDAPVQALTASVLASPCSSSSPAPCLHAYSSSHNSPLPVRIPSSEFIFCERKVDIKALPGHELMKILCQNVKEIDHKQTMAMSKDIYEGTLLERKRKWRIN